MVVVSKSKNATPVNVSPSNNPVPGAHGFEAVMEILYTFPCDRGDKVPVKSHPSSIPETSTLTPVV